MFNSYLIYLIIYLIIFLYINSLKKTESDKDEYKKKVKDEFEKLNINQDIYDELLQKMESPQVIF